METRQIAAPHGARGLKHKRIAVYSLIPHRAPKLGNDRDYEAAGSHRAVGAEDCDRGAGFACALCRDCGAER